MAATNVDTDLALREMQRQIRPCIQCGTCTGSCPNATEMDLTPRRMWRLVLLGRLDDVMVSRTFILCSDCYTCTLRCPRGLPLTTAMESLKGIAFARRQPQHRISRLFYDAFLQTVRRYGRIHETAFMTRYFTALKDPSAPLRFAPLGWKLLGKGKMITGPGPPLPALDVLFDTVARLDAPSTADEAKDMPP